MTLTATTSIRTAPHIDPRSIPRGLMSVPQWVLWRGEDRNGKQAKVPYRVDGRGRADPTDPTTWSTFEAATEAIQHDSWAGLGFVLTRRAGIVGIDLDRCRDPKSGEIEGWARRIIERLGSHSEVSPSGTGVHIFVKGLLPPGGNRRGRIEMYADGRYLTITGEHLLGTPTTVEDRSAELSRLHSEIFSPTPSPVPFSEAEGVSPTDDSEVLTRARGARNGADFAALYDGGDISAYGGDDSAADLALCSMLAFWTNGDAQQIDRLFRQSALFRPKWDQRRGGRTYGERTIAKALGGPATAHQPSQATRTVMLADQMELFHTPEGDPWVTVQQDGHSEHYPVRSKAFRQWLQRLFFEKEGTVPGAQAVQDAIGVLEGRARFERAEVPVYTRLAEHDGAIYVDLSDPAWTAVEITTTGWRLAPNPPVKFRRSRGMLPLPVPVPGGTIHDLDPFINVATDEDMVLMISWLVGMLRPRGPYPILVEHGEQGSAKSTTARVLRWLIDPNSAPLRAEPRDGHDLIIAATNGMVVALDNLSHLQPWLSDALCRLSTGGGFATRELYTDSDEVLFDAMRPIILNGIEELATRSDLMDRSIVIYLPAIPEDRRRPEAEFWRDFHIAHPKILGALLDAVSRALRDSANVRLPSLPRMADFAVWVTAAEPALRWKAGTFMRAYTGNREAANELTLEASLVATAVRALAIKSHGSWKGTATLLLRELARLQPVSAMMDNVWPKTPRGLTNALRRVAPNLRLVGISVDFSRGADHSSTRQITLGLDDRESYDAALTQRAVRSAVASAVASAEKAPKMASRTGKRNSDNTTADEADGVDAKKPTLYRGVSMNGNRWRPIVLTRALVRG